MDDIKRPVSILVLACLYIAVGAIGFVFHFRELLERHSDAVSIELTELLALVAGIFLLRRQNWARWLALAWIVFHVGLSMMHPDRSLVVHCALCAVIAWILFRPPAGQWFRKASY